MSLILNIDTATPYASVCLAENGTSISFRDNAQQKEHASFVHIAIKEMFAECEIPLTTLDAVAVTAGPGSYTGLRVGMSTAKGLCYALGKPLICINTLEAMAQSAITQSLIVSKVPSNIYLCPMIDARRMEVFTAVYNNELNPVLLACAMVLEENTFHNLLHDAVILFFGDGAAKFQIIMQHPNALFSLVNHSATGLALLSKRYYSLKKFEDIAYTEPTYFKEFYTLLNKPNQ